MPALNCGRREENVTYYENGYNEQLNPQDRIYTNGTLSIQKTFLIYWACEPRLIRSFS
jgi:hypothetical protein